MKYLKSLSLLGIIGFTALLFWATTSGHFWSEAKEISLLAWGKVMLVDLYLGFAIFAFAIFFFETSRTSAIIWTVLLFCLGNVITLFYILIRRDLIFNFFRRARHE